MPTDDDTNLLQHRVDPMSGPWTRVAFGVVAVVATTIGFLGVWLPGLPTTPFLLVALWAAARSSDRLSNRLHRIRVLRTAIGVAEDYAQTRALPLRLKVLSQVMAYSAIPLVYLVTHTVWLSVIVACAAVASTIFMASTPTRPSDPLHRGS
ncbi:MAG TPA: YbaN family protein [Acidimicrobiales bacterium]|nr:YbaN family protein [Acidimicrobiales bacterium]